MANETDASPTGPHYFCSRAAAIFTDNSISIAAAFRQLRAAYANPPLLRAQVGWSRGSSVK